MLHLPLRILWLISCFWLAGCGNAYERISMGEWIEVGKPDPPVGKFPGDFSVETRVEGDGPVVKAGDLVKVRILVTTVPSYSPEVRIERQPQVAWLWVGSEPGRDFDEEYVGTFGSLGSARVRRTLIGRRLHERFEIQLEEGASSASDSIPLRGFFDPIDSAQRRPSRVNGKVVHAPKWPETKLAYRGGIASAEIEVLSVCTAKLFQRTAVLRQWGFMLNMFDTNYRSSRMGILGWTAIDAQCPAPDGRFRLQAGPFYFDSITQPRKLLNWDKSYTDLRPPEEFPEEWEEVASN